MFAAARQPCPARLGAVASAGRTPLTKSTILLAPAGPLRQGMPVAL